MQISDNRVTLGSRHNPLTFYLRTLLYMFVALFLRVLALLPLAALFAFPEGSPLRWLALLCPALLIFLIFPLRFSFAQALVQRKRERYFSFDKALGFDRYGEKLSEGLMHALNILKWGIPLAAMLIAAYYFYKNTDAITLMRGVMSLGAGATAVWCAVANFFRGIFGGGALALNGGLMEGLYTIAGLLALGVLILMWGMIRNSAYRYIWVVASDVERNPRTEARRRLRGRRWEQLGVALVNLVLWLPALLVVAATFKGVISQISSSLADMIVQRKFLLPDLTSALTPLFFAFFVCYMPLLPIRRYLTCFYAVRTLRRNAPKKAGVVVTEGVVAVPTTSSGAPEPESQAPIAQDPLAESQPGFPEAPQDGNSTINS